MSFPIDEYSLLVVSHVWAPLNVVEAAVRKEFNRWDTLARYNVERGHVDLERVYMDEPPPGSVHATRLLLFAPARQPDTTILFVNACDGYSSLLRCMHRHSSCDYCHVRTSSVEDEYPIQHFTYVRGTNVKRTVYTMKDGDRWVFWQEGTPLRAENLHDYTKRRKRDRLTRESLIEILKKEFEWDLLDDRTWTSDKEGIYFIEKQPPGIPVD